MRSVSVLATLALAAASIALAAPAGAMPVEGPGSTADKAKLTCYAGIVGSTADRHVRYDSLKNGRITDSTRSKAKFGFPITAWGYYDQTETKQGGRVLRLDAVTKSGTPRQVSITQAKSGKITSLTSVAFAQNSFKPDLFSEGYGFYAYTIDNGVMKQWRTTRMPSGKLKYTTPVTIDNGFASVTSLQVTGIYKINGVVTEVAFVTTSDGALVELKIPSEKPAKTKVVQLADTGYAGVTELVWSICNKTDDHIWLGAIDPAADVATWTTIKDADGKPKATLQGEISGADDWDLTATY